MRVGLRGLVYLWAGPNSLLGLLWGALAWLLGAQVRCVAGHLEFSGGRLGVALLRWQGPNHFAAMTLGHVMLAVSPAAMEYLRSHEQVHMRQYERWGPLFIPAYLLIGLWLRLRGRGAYWDHPFERQAYEQTACPPHPARVGREKAG